jgi:hypothetical protein
MTANHPTKELVRQYMQRPREARQPLLTPEQVRQQLGWEMLKDEREAQRPR